MQMALLLVIQSSEGTFVRELAWDGQLLRRAVWGLPGLPASLIEQLAANRRIRLVLGPLPGSLLWPQEGHRDSGVLLRFSSPALLTKRLRWKLSHLLSVHRNPQPVLQETAPISILISAVLSENFYVEARLTLPQGEKMCFQSLPWGKGCAVGQAAQACRGRKRLPLAVLFERKQWALLPSEFARMDSMGSEIQLRARFICVLTNAPHSVFGSTAFPVKQ